jgi:formamidopyrimidine-DNA glycosylase
MTGYLMFLERGEGPPLYSRVRFDFEDGGSMIFADMRKFGAIGLTPSKEAFLKMKRLGPDALAIERGDFVDRAGGHRRPIKTVLLDQSVLAGVGNLYSDEVLFQCGVHPLALADGLGEDRLGCIHRNLAIVLRSSLDVGTDFDRLPEGYLLRARHPTSTCPKGHGPWHTMKVNGRTAYFCPRCQRL